MAMNLVILTGRLVKDPELKYGANGTDYCRFTLAVSRQFDKEKSDFISCTSFGKTAELVGEYLRKGSLTGIQGRLQQDTYEKDGKTEYKTGVTIEKVEFLESKKENENNKIETPKKSNKVKMTDVKVDLPKKEEEEIEFDDSDSEFPF